MQFELSEALINQLLFAMEDQDGNSLLDTVRLLVVDDELRAADDVGDLDDGGGEADEISRSEIEAEIDPDRYTSIPEWRSADGFRLMERFTASLRNQMVRDQLSAALERGRGVFRAFKDVLSLHPEIEKRWYAFKEKEMRHFIRDWYNALRDEWGLNRIGEEPEETTDLVLEDFRFRASREEDLLKAESLYELRRQETGVPPGLAVGPDCLAAARSRGPEHFIALSVETARGDFAGVAVAVSLSANSPDYQIVRLEIMPEYRGLGVGEELVTRLRTGLPKRPGGRVYLDLPTGADQFARVLDRLGFSAYETRYRYASS